MERVRASSLGIFRRFVGKRAGEIVGFLRVGQSLSSPLLQRFRAVPRCGEVLAGESCWRSPGRVCSPEDFDHHHRRTAGGTHEGVAVCFSGIGLLGGNFGWLGLLKEECTNLLHREGTLVVGKQTEVPDAVKARGKDMEKKAPDELVWV